MRRRSQNQELAVATVTYNDGTAESVSYRQENDASTNYYSPATTPTTKSKRRLKGRSKKQRNNKKHVRFAKHDQVYEIPHLDDMLPSQIDDIWISQVQLEETKTNADTIITFIEQGGPDMVSVMLDLGDGTGIRGLEQQTPSYLRRKDAMLGLLYDAIGRLQPFSKHLRHRVIRR